MVQFVDGITHILGPSKDSPFPTAIETAIEMSIEKRSGIDDQGT